ncbi:MAG: D-glycero-beta-D-manno-heptose 1-phosphate adenylyltransferase [Synergistaceae bacterium]|jgi:D-beta-D-heptose 7-phosphate kinase/D-beta-D-heptose 1-phosphate adenosyltransferase|nr:D-glycero-beta-D-manno-heptose 1-phosphate adenylyltransferase [Synergistaceae bacterium]
MNLEGRLRPKNILVAGDVILDIYSSGDVRRISPEAPVPVFKKISERHAMGGASNVAVNLVSTGQRVSLLSTVGDDARGNILMELFRDMSLDSRQVYRSKTRRTTVKTRFVASNNQQVMRLDEEDSHPLSDEELAALTQAVQKNIQQYDLVILSDYLKGALTFDLAREIIGLAAKAGIRVLVDPKDSNVKKYAGSFLLKPNIQELHDLTGRSPETFDEIAKASEFLCAECGCEYVLTTCGGRGMVLTRRSGEYHAIESAPAEVYDVTGAGDTVIAYLGACLANGFPIMEAVACANIAAGLQVSKMGTSPVYLHEVDMWTRKNGRDGRSHKIIPKTYLPLLRKGQADKKIVFTNGCFDILHYGHVDYLRKAAYMGDVLVVGLNSDESVRRLKGPGRPVNEEEDRASLLAALEFVDYVVIFEEDTPYELILNLQPDVLAKGADYSPEEVIGRDLVESRGGVLALIPLVEGKSTTAIIERFASKVE